MIAIILGLLVGVPLAVIAACLGAYSLLRPKRLGWGPEPLRIVKAASRGIQLAVVAIVLSWGAWGVVIGYATGAVFPDADTGFPSEFFAVVVGEVFALAVAVSGWVRCRRTFGKPASA